MSGMVSVIIYNLRQLFSSKDRLVGVDDWDAFIGILMALENLKKQLEEKEREQQKIQQDEKERELEKGEENG